MVRPRGGPVWRVTRGNRDMIFPQPSSPRRLMPICLGWRLILGRNRRPSEGPNRGRQTRAARPVPLRVLPRPPPTTPRGAGSADASSSIVGPPGVLLVSHECEPINMIWAEVKWQAYPQYVSISEAPAWPQVSPRVPGTVGRRRLIPSSVKTAQSLLC